MAEHNFTDENFDQEVLQSDVPVLIDFWATWCGPCKMQSPIVEELARDFSGKPVKIGKLNVDEAPHTTQRYGVMSIPTIAIFKAGQMIDQMIGVQDKETLAARLEKALA